VTSSFQSSGQGRVAQGTLALKLPDPGVLATPIRLTVESGEVYRTLKVTFSLAHGSTIA